jgi:argininosuccinate lyase
MRAIPRQHNASAQYTADMTTKNKNTKPWSGRFTMPTAEFVECFTESVSYDQRLALVDIKSSMAHAEMLAHTGVLSKQEAKQITQGLKVIEKQIQQGKFKWDPALEDVHMNIEYALTAQIGDVGKKLHTGRSRNDQVATDIRLYLRDEIQAVRQLLTEVMSTLLDIAEKEAETIMPGFTHLQTAQPITFGHHLLAWFEMLYRDSLRLEDCRKRVNVMPLGAGALAGTSYPIDRTYTAKLLDFPAITENSLDAVSDRDFAIEFCHCSAVIMMHLSRFSEELVLWMSQQFAFIDLDDAWCTGSSMMPQKKNPDIPELVRGKTGRVYGHLMALLTLMKSQPLAYNRDNQEDKLALFDAVDTVKQCLQAYLGIIPDIRVKVENMRAAANQGYATATDLADYLVRKQVPFRDAHAIVGQVVHYAIEQNKPLSGLSIKELQQFSKQIDQDVFACLSLEGSVSARTHVGGTAPKQVQKAIKQAHKRLAKIII